MNSSIKVFAPATVANVGCGFDVLGFAIHGPGDKIIMRLNETKKVSVESITGDNGSLSKNANENTVSVAVLAMLKRLKSNQGLSIELHKQMPLKSGLGSSAASAVAGIVTRAPCWAALASNAMTRRSSLSRAIKPPASKVTPAITQPWVRVPLRFRGLHRPMPFH